MAARLTDKQKKKIIADYLELDSYNAVAKKYKIADTTVKRVILSDPEMQKKAEDKKDQNTKDILAYMEGKRDKVCAIIGISLDTLPDKIKRAKTASDVTTALGTIIDKWAAISGGQNEEAAEDGLSRSLREMAESLESDDD